MQTRRKARGARQNDTIKPPHDDKENNVPVTRTAASPASGSARRPRRHVSSSRGFSVSISRRREYFEARAQIAHEALGEIRDPRVLAFSPSQTDASAAAKHESDDAPDVLDAQWLCDSSLPALELARRMNQGLAALRRLPNLLQSATAADDQSSTSSVSELAQALAADAFTKHASESVQLMTACLYAEILRVTAPDPPIAISRLKTVCNLFLDQLAVLGADAGADALRDHRFGLLEQLATVKALVVLCDDADVVADAFACAYALAQDTHTHKLTECIVDLLASLIEEAEEVSQGVLDALLAPFAPRRAYGHPAIVLAGRVLQRCHNHLRAPVCNFLNATVLHAARLLRKKEGSARKRRRLRGEDSLGRLDFTDDDMSDAVVSADDDGHSAMLAGRGSAERAHESELISDVQDILVAIARAVPEVIEDVLLNLARHSRSSAFENRLCGVRVLGKVLESFGPEASSHLALVADVLERMNDAEAEVRVASCEAMRSVLKNVTGMQTKIGPSLEQRLLDREETVRIAAARTIALCCPQLGFPIFRTLAGRIRDRKPSVRRVAIDGLGRFVAFTGKSFREAVKASATAGSADEPRERESDPKELLGRLSWAACELLNAVSILVHRGDVESVLAVERVLVDTMYGPNTDPEARLVVLCAVAASFTSKQLSSFEAIVSRRGQLRAVIAELSAERCRRPSEGAASSAYDDVSPVGAPSAATASRGSRTTHHEQLLRAIRPFTKHGDDLSALCLQLVSVPDRNFYRQLAVALDNDQSPQDAQAAFRDAVARAGSKSKLGLFLTESVAPLLAPGIFSGDLVGLAVQVCRGLWEAPDKWLTKLPGLDASGLYRYLLLYVRVWGRTLPRSAHATLVSFFEECELMAPDAKLAPDEARNVRACLLILVAHGDQSLLRDCPARLLNALSDVCAAKASEHPMCWLNAKWAARAALRLISHPGTHAEEASGFVSRLVDFLSEFDGDLCSIVGPLNGLAQFAKYGHAAYKVKALEVFDICRTLLAGSFNSKIHAAVERQQTGKAGRSMESSAAGSGEGRPCSVSAEVVNQTVRAAVKAMVRSLVHLESPHEEIRAVTGALTMVFAGGRADVFEIASLASDSLAGISGDSALEDGLEDTHDILAWSRFHAANGMLWLARHPKLYSSLMLTDLQAGMLAIQDEHPEVRLCYARKLCNAIIRKRLPYRWIASLALLAVDPDKENLSEVREMLFSAVRYRRLQFARTQAKKGASADSVLLLPEYVLATLVWVLANHPDAWTEMEGGMRESQKCVDFFLEGLLNSADHYALVAEIFGKLSVCTYAASCSEVDTASSVRERVAELSRLGSALLKKRRGSKKIDLTLTVPEFRLPPDLYGGQAVRTRGRKEVIEAARRYDESDVNSQARGSARRRRPPDEHETHTPRAARPRTRNARSDQVHLDAGAPSGVEHTSPVHESSKHEGASGAQQTGSSEDQPPLPRRSKRRRS